MTEPETFSPNVMTAVCTIVIVGGQAISRWMGNRKTEDVGTKVTAGTAAQTTVDEIKVEVIALRAEFEAYRAAHPIENPVDHRSPK